MTDETQTVTQTPEEVAAERDALQARVDKLETQVKKLNAKPKATVERKAAPEKLRNIGPLAEKDQLDTATLGERLNGGGLEIAFSDGKREIKGLPPIGINGNVWQSWSGRWRLTEPLQLKGPGPNDAPFTIKGLGLFDEDGKQLAYSEQPEPIVVRPGQTVELKGSVLF